MSTCTAAPTRRLFLKAAVIASAVATGLAIDSGPATAGVQDQWRFCPKCQAMFFDGYPGKGRCPAGEGHVAVGYYFRLPHDVSQTANAQRDWRFCNNCYVMFFDGYRSSGRCAAGSELFPV